MPRFSPDGKPKYRLHRASGQAVVTISGKDHYLGPHGSKASRLAYDQKIAAWLAAGRPDRPVQGPSDLTITELCVAYTRHADEYYGKKQGGAIRVSVRALRAMYGNTNAINFGPLSLKALRNHLVAEGRGRKSINKAAHIIRSIFRWAASEELLPASVYQELESVTALREGHTAAPETAPVQPVADAVVEETLPHLSPVVADMVRFQRLTGCRPAEVCLLRPCDIDQSGEVWLYTPRTHKTAHFGKQRVICIGPKAQRVIKPYLKREPVAACFSPAESGDRRREILHAKRKTPLSCGNRPGSNRKSKPKKKAGQEYNTASYRRAIDYAVTKANRVREKATADAGQKGEVELLSSWSPNQLRHAAATEIRKLYGIEAAQVTLGHSTAYITQIYAQRDLNKAAEVMKALG